MIRRLTQSGQILHAIHDMEGNRIAEYLFDEVAGTSTLIREYLWLDGVPVAVYENETLYYIRTDHIHCPAGYCAAMPERGRPVFATDDAGVVVWEATYLPFGGVHISSGTPVELLRAPPVRR